MKPKFTVLFEAIENGVIDASQNEVMTIQEFGDDTLFFYKNELTTTSYLRAFIQRLYEIRSSCGLKHARIVLRDSECDRMYQTLCYF